VQIVCVNYGRSVDAHDQTEQLAEFLHIVSSEHELPTLNPQHVGVMYAASPSCVQKSQTKSNPSLSQRCAEALRAFCSESSTHCADYVLNCAKGGHMAIYVDNERIRWRGKLWCHLVGDSLDELHAFAGSLGLKRAWFQSNASYPHYDVTTGVRERALQMGAIAASKAQMLASARTMKTELLELRRIDGLFAGSHEVAAQDRCVMARAVPRPAVKAHT
jgi:hypothetical protein